MPWLYSRTEGLSAGKPDARSRGLVPTRRVYSVAPLPLPRGRERSAGRWPSLEPLMNEGTRILSAIERGDPAAAEQLLPLVYGELRKLAAAKLAQEKPGQTLEATALVHEAYLRLVASPRRESGEDPRWDSRGHFFAAAAEAMRRILVEQARR